MLATIKIAIFLGEWLQGKAAALHLYEYEERRKNWGVGGSK